MNRDRSTRLANQKASTDWRCRIGRHAYVRRRSEPSARATAAFYLECRRCRKVRPLVPSSHQPYPIGDMDYGASL